MAGVRCIPAPSGCCWLAGIAVIPRSGLAELIAFPIVSPGPTSPSLSHAISPRLPAADLPRSMLGGRLHSANWHRRPRHNGRTCLLVFFGALAGSMRYWLCRDGVSFLFCLGQAWPWRHSRRATDDSRHGARRRPGFACQSVSACRVFFEIDGPARTAHYSTVSPRLSPRSIDVRPMKRLRQFLGRCVFAGFGPRTAKVRLAYHEAVTAATFTLARPRRKFSDPTFGRLNGGPTQEASNANTARGGRPHSPSCVSFSRRAALARLPAPRGRSTL